MRMMIVTLWGVCIRPIGKFYDVETTDTYGLPSVEKDSIEYIEGNGYLFTIRTVFDDACDKSPLQLFVEGDNRESHFDAVHRTYDGLVHLEAADLRHFEPAEIQNIEYYNLESDAQIDDIEEYAASFVDEFPNARRLYADDDFQLPF